MKEIVQKKYKAHGGILKDLLIQNKSQENLQDKLLSLPHLNLNPRQLCDLELLMNGGFSPLEGFMGKEDYENVVKKMRLKNGILWPIPVVLDVVNKEGFREGSEIILCDEYGYPIAFFLITSVYKPDKRTEAKYVYRTLDKTHFGVRYLMEDVGNYYIGGKVYGINSIIRHDFKELRFTPQKLREWFKKNRWEKIIGFQTRNPLHKAHYTMIRTAALGHEANVLLHPSVGLTKDGDIDYITRVRCYIKLQANYMRDFAKLSLLPLAMRMAGPREAIWHAIIRRNYGCTHFIVGRDHAGSGKNARGKPFYGSYEAQELAKKYEKELGIIILPFQEMVYVEELKRYIPWDKVEKQHTVKKISGTEFRRKLLKGEEIPEWFSFPEIITELRQGLGKQRKDGLTIFFTGFSGAGKSTIAKILYFKLLELQDKQITLLDGDVVRQNLSKGLGFTPQDRNTNIERIGFVANEITRHRGIAICAAIAPYNNSREKNRHIISKNGTYVEVYIATPLAICKKRDTKGLYEKTKRGIIKGMTGVDDPYEIPRNPEIILDTTNISPEKSVSIVLNYLQKNNLIKIQ